MEIKLSIIKETSVLGRESYHLMFGSTYIPNSLCDTYERAKELFDNFKNQITEPKKEEVHSEYITVKKHEPAN